MSKVLEATCVAGVVTADSLPVVGANILSEGVGSSEGALLLDGTKKIYVTSNATDIKALIEAVSSMVTNVITVLTSHDTLVAGANAATIAALTAANVQLIASKELLK